MSKVMRSNGTNGARAGTSSTNRVAGNVNAGDDAPGVQSPPAETAPAAAPAEGKTGKVLLGIGAAIIAIVATEYALRKFTKTGGIIPHLLRLEKLANAYLATIQKP